MNQDLDVISAGQELAGHLADPRAKKYLCFGFNIRALQIKESKFHLKELLVRDGLDNRGPYETLQTNIFLNSFYINLIGAIDNLAWVLQHEFNIIDGASESNKKRNKIVLYGKDFGIGLKKLDDELFNEFERHSNWFDSVKKFRDPVAHRMPLYCPPGIVTDEHTDAYKQASDTYLEQDYTTDRDSFMNSLFDLSRIGEFRTIFFGFSENDQDAVFPFQKTINDDYQGFWSLSETILHGLRRNLTTNNRVQNNRGQTTVSNKNM